MATTIEMQEVECMHREVYLETHISELEQVANQLDLVNGGLHRLADRLFGSQPRDITNEAANQVPNGIIGECQSRANELLSLANQIGTALERLEQIA